MSSAQSAIAKRNGVVLKISVDANGDLLNSDNELKVTSSSEEDIASYSSKDDESDDIISIKTRYIADN